MESSKIQIADRQPTKNPAHQGNPLIEALFDPLPSEKFYEILAQRSPLKRSEVIKYPIEVIEQHLDNIRANFLVPNRRLFSVYDLIHSSINSSYSVRNPSNRSIKLNLQKDYRNLINQFNENFENTFSKSSMLIGVSGIGKTTAINVASSLFPVALRHEELDGDSFVQIPIIKIECPKDGSIKDLCRYFFIELDRKLGTRYEFAYCRARDTASDRVVAMSKLVAAHCIGVLIVDEIQHLLQSKGGLSETMLNFFLNLDNTLHIPIIIVGTPEALELFSEKQRLRRRFTAGAGLKWDRLPNDVEWTIIIKHLLKFQYTAEVANPKTNWAEVFYFHSQGIIDRAVKLFVASQKWAFSIGADSINIEIINKVVGERMWLDEEMINSIREHDLHVDKYSDMILPEESSDYQDNYRLVNIQSELIDFKISENFSFPLIEQLIQENPSLGDIEIAFQIIKKYQSLNKDESKSSKEKLVANYIERDLRNLNTDNEELLHEQLSTLGVIVTLENFMISK